MTDPSDGFQRRTRIAAAESGPAGPLQAGPGHVDPVQVDPGQVDPGQVDPGQVGSGQAHDLDELAMVSRITRVAAVVLTLAALAVIGSVVFALASVADSVGVRWGTAAILLVLLVGTGVLCAHAGGHAWFVPLPALALAVIWAFTTSEGSAGAAWWLVALSALGCAGGVLVAGAALRQRLRGVLVGLPELRGTTGVAVTALDPGGIVRVAGENWSAKSVSGPLRAGAPVHVLGVRGVRLDVWSEQGTVPDHTVLAIEEDKP